MVSFISACSTPSPNTKQQTPVFSYPRYPALDITKTNTCTESVAPYFQQLGIQCRCNNYPNGYSYRSNEPGVTTRCIPPKQWLAQKREEEILRNQHAREEQLRKLEAEREWERTRPQREAQARYAAEQERIRLNSTCPIYYAARQSCATAAHYPQCMNIRLSNRYSQYDDQTCFNR
jgi:hypothetical protein